MKRHLTVLVLAACLILAATVPVLAGIPAKSELGISGALVHPKSGGNVYAFDGQLAAPLNQGGNVVLGPRLRYASDSAQNAAGAVLEWNLLGTGKSGPFLGATGLYNLKEVAGTERYSVDAIAGLKLQVGKGGFVRVQAAKAVAGRDKDSTDLYGSVGIGLRF